MRQIGNIVLERTPAAQALDLKLVSRADLMRLKVIARWHARGLPAQVGWSDLLQEAFARVLDGSRRKPDGVPVVAFLAGVMRSIKAEYWRRARVEARRRHQLLAELEIPDTAEGDFCDPAPNPERALMAVQELDAIQKLFAEDAQARKVIAGLYEGLSPDEIRAAYHLSKTGYDSTRKRMRRVLLQEGLRLKVP